MTFDEWWEEFTAEHDEWRYADSQALRRAAFKAGAASRDAEIAELRHLIQRIFETTVPYDAQGNHVFCGFNHSPLEEHQMSLAFDEAIRARGDMK